MTLDTRIYALDAVPVRDLFQHCQALLTRYDEKNRTPDQQASRVDEGADQWTMRNMIGQGLPAILEVYYKPAGPLRTDADQSAHDEYCNMPESEWWDEDLPVCDGSRHRIACHVEVSFDTAYGFQGPEGMGCGDLHAVLVGEVGQWLDERGVRWRWLDECAGEVRDGYDSLVHLVSNGFQASSWFRTTVMPVIERSI